MKKSILLKYRATIILFIAAIGLMVATIVNVVKYNRCSNEFKAIVTDLGEYSWRNSQGILNTFYKPEYIVKVNDRIIKYKEEKGRDYLPWDVDEVDSVTILRINPNNYNDWINKNLMERDITVTIIYSLTCIIAVMISVSIENGIQHKAD